MPRTDWGYSRNDTRGDIILDICSIYEMYLANDTSEPLTYHLQGRYGCPDLTMATDDMRDRVTDWKVHLDDSGSDHRYISFRIDFPFKRRESGRYKTKFCCVSSLRHDLAEAAAELSRSLEGVTDVGSLDTRIDDLYERLHQICRKHFKIKRNQQKSKLTWWTPALSRKRTLLTALYRR